MTLLYVITDEVVCFLEYQAVSKEALFLRKEKDKTGFCLNAANSWNLENWSPETFIQTTINKLNQFSWN